MSNKSKQKNMNKKTLSSQHQKFKFNSPQELSEKARELGIQLPWSNDIRILFDNVKIAGKTLPNRFVIHPMEGFDADESGTPGELCFRRYRRYAAGGSGLIWFEATAVVPEGRSSPRQLFIHEKNVDAFKRLVEETKITAHRTFGSEHELLLVLQITHSGRYSRPKGKAQPIIAQHNKILDRIQKIPENYPLITDKALDRLQDDFVLAAHLAAEAGFDGVDVKACHGYLISELLASFTRKDSKYGGSFENRTRFLRETAQKITDNVKTIFVTSRLNGYDAVEYPYGFGVDRDDPMKPDLNEPKMLIKELIDIGYPLLNVTIGNPHMEPRFSRPFDLPLKGGVLPSEHPLMGVARLIQIVGELQLEFPEFPLVGTGYAWLRHYFPYVAARVVKQGKATLIGQGRGAFAYPDAVKDLQKKGVMDAKKVCLTCSKCSQLIRDGGRTGCVIRDSEIYAAEYRKMRKKSEHCSHI